MSKQEKLALLKYNLQLTTNANDDLLNFFLDTADARIKREGVTDDDSIDYASCQIDYAAYLFRKRAAGQPDSGMPRFLRWAMNNLLFSQKAGGDA